MLPFWCEQLDETGNWVETFRRWRCHPEDWLWDHLEESLVTARNLVTEPGFCQRAVHEQLAAIISLSHGEQLPDHDLAIASLQALLDEDSSLASLDEELRARHEVIRQFGRFPARNRPLKRASTPTEAYYMLGPGPRFQ